LHDVNVKLKKPSVFTVIVIRDIHPIAKTLSKKKEKREKAK